MFACTVLVIVPSVLLLVVPPLAFQHHATYVSPFAFIAPLFPVVNPSESKEIIASLLIQTDLLQEIMGL